MTASESPPELILVTESRLSPAGLQPVIAFARMSGRELAEKVVAARPATQVLFMSGYTEDMLVHQGVASSSADFIHKPFNLDVLSRKVRDVLDRS